MCFESEARPPAFVSSITVSTRSFRLPFDGGDMAASFSYPEEMNTVKTGIVVLPDNRGLSPFYVQFAEQLASCGFPAVAIDYFARGEEPAPEPKDPRQIVARIAQLTKDGCYGQITAALRYLRQHSGVQRAVAIGFCMGGRLAFLAAQPQFGFSGVIGLYGSTEAILDAPGPWQLAKQLRGPILGIFGGADAYIPAESVESFQQALKESNVAHEIVVYPGAPHSFFDVQQEQYQDICADVWTRMIGFLHRPE